jgi:hypothetical protein
MSFWKMLSKAIGIQTNNSTDSVSREGHHIGELEPPESDFAPSHELQHSTDKWEKLKSFVFAKQREAGKMWARHYGTIVDGGGRVDVNYEAMQAATNLQSAFAEVYREIQRLERENQNGKS